MPPAPSAVPGRAKARPLRFAAAAADAGAGGASPSASRAARTNCASTLVSSSPSSYEMLYVPARFE